MPLLSQAPASPPPTDGRRLRVGYISRDFTTHSVAYFLEPLLANHDRAAFEIFCYSDVERPDATTARLRTYTDHWCSIVGQSDDAVTGKIRGDAIDILVDLAGHSKGNRLLVFARRAAPVQVTWLGYPNTTGLRSMDYRVTDEISDPTGVAEKLATETLIRLPGGFICYRPASETPELLDPPSRVNGAITFGNFNSIAKLTPEIISLWSQLLNRIPGSKLLLKSNGLGDEVLRARILGNFETGGIDPTRIELLGWTTSTYFHLALYNKIDIALDTSPYNGTTTTCEALWMGVPVVTLVGDRHAARVGASILTQIDMTDCIALNEAAYVDIAFSLANDPEKLNLIRRSCREKLRSSPLMDEAGFARQMEAAFHTMVDLKRQSAA